MKAAWMLLAATWAAVGLAGCQRTPTAAPPVEPNPRPTVAASSESTGPRRWAIVVGINQYEKLKPLSYSAPDALALQSILCRSGGYDPQHVLLLADFAPAGAARGSSPDLTRPGGAPIKDNVLGALDYVTQQARPGDTVLFAFSGHGMAQENRGYLMPLDGDPANLAATAIPMSSVYDRLKRCGATGILIVDACHSGGTRGFEGPAVNQRILSAAALASGTYGLFSCDTNQESYEDPQLGHGVFTKFLIDGMRGFADRDEDFQVTVDEIHAYVAARVPEHVKLHFAGKEQTPYRVVAGTGSAPVVSVYQNRPYSEENLQLLVLPGLYGGSWQADAPWLLPGLRDEIAAMLPKEVVAARPRKRQGAEARAGLLSADVNGIYEQLRVRMQEYVNRSEKDVARQDLLRSLLEWDGTADDEPAKASLLAGVGLFDDPHSLAVFLARFDREEEANALFLKARAAYEQQDPQPTGLVALCLADHAACRSALLDYAQAASLYHDACHKTLHPGDAPLFSIQCLCSEADARRKLADWERVGQCLNEAEQIAQAYLDPHHPLAAYIQERQGWQFMDQWRVTEASVAFQKALQIWAARDKQPGSDAQGGNPQVSQLHDQHGLAMATRYAGNVDVAIRLYVDLAAKVADARDAGAADVKTRNTLTGRLINTLERLADCFLLGTPQQPKRAARALEQAFSGSQGLPADKARDATQALLLCKWAIALQLDGDTQQAAAKLARRQQLAPKESDILLLYTRAASDLLKPEIDEATFQAMQASIVAAADAKELVPNRDKLDLLLFVSDQVIRRVPYADVDWQLPFSVVPASFLREDVLPYLRPIYDRGLARGMAGKSPLPMGSLIRSAWIAKTGKRVPNSLILEDGELVVVYYSHGPDFENLPGQAIWERDDGTGEVIPLPPLCELRLAAEKGDKLTWPAALTTRSDQAPVRVRVLWHDKPLRLANSQFPFELPAGWELVSDGP